MSTTAATVMPKFTSWVSSANQLKIYLENQEGIYITSSALWVAFKKKRFDVIDGKIILNEKSIDAFRYLKHQNKRGRGRPRKYYSASTNNTVLVSQSTKWVVS